MSEPDQAAPEGRRPMRTRRVARCDGCRLPPLLCMCDELRPIEHAKTKVTVLMHVVELHKPSNTGRLLSRMLPGASIVMRGIPREDRDAVARDAVLSETDARPLLLFPLEGARVLTPEDAGRALIVPDGTWRQARRIARRDPHCRHLEPVTIPKKRRTLYRLRHAPSDDALSTLEAVAIALGIVEGATIEAELMHAFDELNRRGALARQGRQGEERRNCS